MTVAHSWQAKRGAPVIIDNDCGVDDATGLLVALRKHVIGEIRLVGVTCVDGNCSLDHVLHNVAAVKALFTSEAVSQIPVFAGAHGPLVQPRPPPQFFHGRDGLGDTTERGVTQEQHPDVPRIQTGVELQQPEHAANAIVRLARTHPGELTLIALGPLTNIALALRLEPQLPSLVASFVFMGGTSRGSGNVTPVAEANFFADPEAAAVCLQEFDCSVMLSWEATLDHPMAWPWVDHSWLVQDSPQGRFTAATWSAIAGKVRGNAAGMLLPDPLAVIAALDLNGNVVLGVERVGASVELGGTSRGGVLIDRLGAAETGDHADSEGWKRLKRKNLVVITKMDVDAVQRELLEAVVSCSSSVKRTKS